MKRDVESISYQTVGGSFDKFYPAKGALSTAPNLEFNQQVFETLVQYQNLAQIKPLLALSWNNPNESTWVFNLKPNVKFQDGNTLTAASVKASLEAGKANQELASYTDTLKDITVISPTKIQITTVAPDALFLAKLTNIFIYDSKPPAGTKNSDTGTGPYIVKPGTNPTAERASLSAFDAYHGGHVSTRNLIFTAESEDTPIVELEASAIIALKKSTINLDGPVSPSTARDAKQANLNIYNYGDLDVR